ncbi:MAG: hypothetical protein ACYDCP_03725 [Thermoplasmataceae archaeon]
MGKTELPVFIVIEGSGARKCLYGNMEMTTMKATTITMMRTIFFLGLETLFIP